MRVSQQRGQATQRQSRSFVPATLYAAASIRTFVVWHIAYSDVDETMLPHNSSLQPTVIPLRGLPAAELWR
jgi:hypothetical protein